MAAHDSKTSRPSEGGTTSVVLTYLANQPARGTGTKNFGTAGQHARVEDCPQRGRIITKQG